MSAPFPMPSPLRRLVLVLGDQLWLDNPALAGFDPAQDAVLMIEAPGEASHVWSHKARIALFLSAMRHFQHTLARKGFPVRYVTLDDTALDQPATATLPARLQRVLKELQPQALWLCEAGEWRLQQDIEAVATAAAVPLRWFDDTHFFCSRQRFARWTQGRKEWRMEFFYREMRREHGVLMDGGQPVGGQWNFDVENRGSYPKQGPGLITPPAHFEPDALTREVIELVQSRFADHPGELKSFGWPVTHEQAREALRYFVAERLEMFGTYQDAMWTNTPFGWHSLLSVALNLHLIDPREVVAAAEAAHRDRSLPLASVEGFIRQVLGWREFIRGVYWMDMPGMKTANHFDHQRDLPAWYWNAQTRMACMKDAVGQTLEHGYAHHIQRLMLTGQFALLAEVKPRQVADWYLAVYVDAIEWVELPNVAGMALFADGGRFTSKPYVASGQYIDRMSNHCKGCAYQPKLRTGPTACPVTTLYWNFLDRHETELAKSPRTALMVKNLQRMEPAERQAVRDQAVLTLARLDDL